MLPITAGIQVGPWLAVGIPLLVVAGLWLVRWLDR